MGKKWLFGRGSRYGRLFYRIYGYFEGTSKWVGLTGRDGFTNGCLGLGNLVFRIRVEFLCEEGSTFLCSTERFRSGLANVSLVHDLSFGFQ